MEAVDSISQSVWQDSQIMPENSIHLAENVEGFQKCVKEILDLIKQDENSSETTPEIRDSKKSKLTTLVTNLSRMHGELADQLLKNHNLDSSDSTSPQVTQMFTPDQKSAHKFMTPIGFDVLLSSGGNGGSYNQRTEASDSSFSLSSDSESESSVSVNKLLISPLNDDSSKSKELKVQDPDVLLKKISVLDTKIQTLTEENTKLKNEINENESDFNSQNTLLEVEKSNVLELQEQVSDFKLVIFESNLKIETLQDKLNSANDEISDLKNELSSKIIEIGKNQEDMELLQIQINSQKVKILELQDEVDSYVADIQVRDDEIKELNNKISLMESSHLLDMKRLKLEVSEKSELINVLNHKHDAVMLERDVVKSEVDTIRAEMSHRENLIREMEARLGLLRDENARVVLSFGNVEKVKNEVEVKVVELEREVERLKEEMVDRDEEKREVIRQLSFSLDYYMSGYKELCRVFGGNKRRAVLTS